MELYLKPNFHSHLNIKFIELVHERKSPLSVYCLAILSKKYPQTKKNYMQILHFKKNIKIKFSFREIIWKVLFKVFQTLLLRKSSFITV